MGVVLANIAAQFREELSELYLAERKLAAPERRQTSAKMDRTAAYIDQSFLRMTRMAQSMETCAAFMRGEAFERENCDIVGLVSEICEESADLAQYLNVELRFSCGEASHVCAVRKEYIRQLCYHLLSNALKSLSPGGCVRVGLRFPRKSGRIELSVEDNGRGIEADRLPTLFEFPTDTDRLSGRRGSGLGLPVCKKIVEGHGGVITAESKPGRGSKFTVSLPDETSKTVRFRQPDFYVPSGGIHPSLLGLSDALPWEAFKIGNQL